MTNLQDGNHEPVPSVLVWDEDVSAAASPATAMTRGWVVASVTAGVTLLLILGFFVGKAIGADAMATCQLTHSFDVCFLTVEG